MAVTKEIKFEQGFPVDALEVLDTSSFDWMRAETFRRGGRVWESRDHIIVHVPGYERLVVTFDNLAASREEEKRMPWGYDAIMGQGWGCLGVMTKKKSFFQCPGLHDDLERIKAEGLFEEYDGVSFYGASAGGFAAAAFAGLSPGATVVAMSPQSSLSNKHAPFETRYSHARQSEGWNDTPDRAYRDAVSGIRTAGKAYLIYDPMEPIDRQHIARLRGSNTIELRAANFTHKLPPMFRRMGTLKTLAVETMKGEMTESAFYKLIRGRKDVIPHALQVINNALDRGHLDLAEQGVEFALSYNPNWKLRHLRNDIRKAREEA